MFEPIDGVPGIITAGTSSGITDGGAAVVLADEEEAARRGLTLLGRIVGWATTGVDPRIMGIGPVPAVRKLLDRTGLRSAISIWSRSTRRSRRRCWRCCAICRSIPPA